jgi:hypothetical protein
LGSLLTKGGRLAKVHREVQFIPVGEVMYPRLAHEGPLEFVGNLLTPTLSSTSVWRRGRRRGRFPFMSQPW